MNAIHSDEYGRAEIDYDKCVSCGMCLVSCPFSAIVDKGQIYQTIMAVSYTHLDVYKRQGTSMLQIPNIMKRPLIWLPPTLASAILGPIAIIGPFHMTNNATGSGMGTSGLVGQIMTYQTMVATESPVLVILKIVVFHFLLPGLLSYVIYRGMRNMGYIKDGQMKLSV